jgi:hypothetical protein
MQNAEGCKYLSYKIMALFWDKKLWSFWMATTQEEGQINLDTGNQTNSNRDP